ncbi:LysR family transcriptional regulator [Burkholderia multivorans]|uniref:LysR family transcriptional regulator n=1 Tax=Burkholderia multivorans TaxID=87883 RepID=UPI001C21754F|nr:LysR family transcriptional regulator [Burkholderia multivorans]MBU9205435.1 LysR family transcriptional regulator [Burkholderia multivorans]MCO8353444.1 LysR family transcriptional regulator [Burkholderia multivorans]MCO8385703.1 LysR family transcriptional regulator [Burkholderia multivorans]MCO8406616.1 LysR family transcriptional regulator [Burkholderia multivorans]MCO8434799.1 LysR family transcriptional regulator [Burkholderia multivorans]
MQIQVNLTKLYVFAFDYLHQSDRLALAGQIDYVRGKDRKMDVITHVRTFAAVARYGSFTEAAHQLDIAPSVVARRISQLEKELNTRLFERTTRKVTLTEAGERFHTRAAELVADFEELVTSVERDAGKLEGHLSVMAPTTLTVRALGPILRSFLEQHPRITMQISLVDRSVNPAESGVDVAISGRLASYDGVVDIPLRPVQPVLCAAPSYLQRQALPTHPRDLARHACLAFSPTGTTWNFHTSRGIVSVDVVPRLTADDNLTLLDAARSGLGIALIPKYVAGTALESGELEPLLPDFLPQENWFKAYVPRRRMNLARVKALLDWLGAQWVDASPEQSGE